MITTLDRARALLDGTYAARGHSVRAAAWLARSALEQALDDLIRAKGCDPGERTSTRTKLSCIEALYGADDPQLVSAAEYTWTVLSQASHHHAYELSPVHAEVAGLIERVAVIERAVNSP